MHALFYNIVIILFFLLTSSQCDFDFDCFELRQSTYYNLDLYVVEASSDDYTNFETIRELNFSRLKKYPELTKDIAIENRLSFDNKVLITENGFDFSLINFTSASQSPEIFTSSDILTIEKPDLVTTSHFDYYPQQKIIRTFYGTDPANGISISQYSFVNSLDPNTLEEDTLKIIRSEVKDDSIFIEKKIYTLRYDPHSDATYFVLNQRYRDYNPTSEPRYDWSPSDKKEIFIMKLYDNHTLDTLSALPDQISYPPLLTISENFLFLHTYNSFLMYDKAGNYIRTMNDVINPHFSTSGNSLTYSNYKMYYNIVENYTIDLSQYVSDISFSQPHEDFILIMEKDQRLHMFSIEQNKIIQSISIFNMPTVEKRRDKVSQLSIYFPVLTEDNKIRLIFTELHYKDDPSDNCEIYPNI